MVSVPVMALTAVDCESPPVTLVDICGKDQVYSVPVGIIPEEGVTLKVLAVQVVVVKLLICAAGFSVTVKVKVEAQAPAAVLTVYTATVAEAVVLISVPVILLCGLGWVAPPENPEPVGPNQVYCVLAGTVPFTPSVGVTVNSANPQATAVIGVIFACGFTVTVNTNGVAGPQSCGLGVIVYVAYCVELVAFTRTPLVMLTAVVPLCPPVSEGLDT